MVLDLLYAWDLRLCLRRVLMFMILYHFISLEYLPFQSKPSHAEKKSSITKIVKLFLYLCPLLLNVKFFRWFKSYS